MTSFSFFALVSFSRILIRAACASPFLRASATSAVSWFSRSSSRSSSRRRSAAAGARTTRHQVFRQGDGAARRAG
eukprot:6654195-Prymnesium_polylepis.1